MLLSERYETSNLRSDVNIKVPRRTQEPLRQWPPGRVLSTPLLIIESVQIVLDTALPLSLQPRGEGEAVHCIILVHNCMNGTETDT